ncbi:MAG: permease [Candidatus Eisenbacteria bacterium]
METLIQIFWKFVHLTLEIAPYFLVGTIAGASLKSWLPFGVVERHLKPGFRSILAVSVFGGAIPVCSCSMVPVAQAMREKGASLGAIVAFLLVAPVLSPVTVFLTWGWLGPEFTIARIIAAFAGGIAVGTIMERFSSYPAPEPTAQAPAEATPARDSCSSSECSCGQIERNSGRSCSRIAILFSNFVIILKDLWIYLLIGVVASAVLSVVVPKDFLPRLVGTGVIAYVLAAVVGVPVYVCSGEEVPIAKALLDINLAPGATFTFLLSSTGICLPTILMASRFLGRKNAALYAALWFAFAVCAGVVFSVSRPPSPLCPLNPPGLWVPRPPLAPPSSCLSLSLPVSFAPRFPSSHPAFTGGHSGSDSVFSILGPHDSERHGLGRCFVRTRAQHPVKEKIQRMPGEEEISLRFRFGVDHRTY